MVVPRFVRRALMDEPLDVYGTGAQSRCFCNVADTVRVLTRLVDCPRAVGEVINIGTSESITMNALAEKVIDMTGSKSQLRHVSYEEAYGRPFDDIMVRVPDLTKVKDLTDYKPKYSLDETLAQIIEYERAKLAAS